MLTGGWTWTKGAAGTRPANTYSFGFKPFLTTKLGFSSSLNLARLAVATFAVTVNEFKTNFLFNILFKGTG
jgi:hypothetical protein